MKIPDITEIAVAWARAMNPTDEQRELAEQRIKICDSCEHKEFKTLIRTYICGACGCPLNKKVYSPLSGDKACPKAKWDK
jgi:ribosomal protein L37E